MGSRGGGTGGTPVLEVDGIVGTVGERTGLPRLPLLTGGTTRLGCGPNATHSTSPPRESLPTTRDPRRTLEGVGQDPAPPRQPSYVRSPFHSASSRTGVGEDSRTYLVNYGWHTGTMTRHPSDGSRVSSVMTSSSKTLLFPKWSRPSSLRPRRGQEEPGQYGRSVEPQDNRCLVRTDPTRIPVSTSVPQNTVSARHTSSVAERDRTTLLSGVSRDGDG